MKKTIAVIFGISITLGLSYLAWAYSGIGKSTLAKWLLKEWKLRADKKQKPIDLKKLQKELQKLDYEDHELLFRFTRLDPNDKNNGQKIDNKMKMLLKKMSERKLALRADLEELKNIIFFDR